MYAAHLANILHCVVVCFRLWLMSCSLPYSIGEQAMHLDRTDLHVTRITAIVLLSSWRLSWVVCAKHLGFGRKQISHHNFPSKQMSCKFRQRRHRQACWLLHRVRYEEKA